jgi:hypothetical protein
MHRALFDGGTRSQNASLPKTFGSGSMGKAFYKEAVEQAAEIAGGYDKLAERLGLAQEDVLSWLQDCRVPMAVFLRIIDIVLENPAATPGPFPVSD